MRFSVWARDSGQDEWTAVPDTHGIIRGPRAKSRAALLAYRASAEWSHVVVRQEGGYPYCNDSIVYWHCRYDRGSSPWMNAASLRFMDMAFMTEAEILERFERDETTEAALELKTLGLAHRGLPFGRHEGWALVCDKVQDIAKRFDACWSDVMQIYYLALVETHTLNPELQEHWPGWDVRLDGMAFTVYEEHESAATDSVATWLLANGRSDRVVLFGSEKEADPSYDPDGEEGLSGYLGTLDGWLKVEAIRKMDHEPGAAP